MAYLPKELQNKFLKDTIIEIIKLLYGVIEAGLYWFLIYFKYYKDKLNIITLTYNPYLLISKGDEFGIIRI